jgi:hypothetical protein
MLDYCKPGRRKIALLTFVIVGVFVAGWIRSRTMYDAIEIGVGRHYFAVSSMNTHLGCCWHQYELAGKDRPFLQVESLDITGGQIVESDPTCGNSDLNLVAGNFHMKAGSGWSYQASPNPTKSHPLVRVQDYSASIQAPYWSIVIPLTLLFAYLLLRQSKLR